MIFVTIGTQLPFDRLIQAVDSAMEQLGTTGFAQIGPGAYLPSHMNFERFVDADRFEDLISRSNCIISHAGMGSIITAMRYGKPAILMPRNAELGEHRNDHQLATARRFKDHPLIRIANDSNEIVMAYLDIQQSRSLSDGNLAPHASQELLDALRSMIFR